VSDPTAPSGDTDPDSDEDPGRAGAAAALRDAFGRLAPQGSHAWNFQGAFNQLADKYGPDHPGTSALAEVLNATPASRTRSKRLRRGGAPSGAPLAFDGTETGWAMATVVEAFRWMSARVTSLEERLEREDYPVSAPAWLVPTAELGEWVDPLTAHLSRATPGGPVLHADCGEGALLGALERAGVPAIGVEPRGRVALTALEAGHTVVIGEVTDLLGDHAPASLGGMVLNGMVDRLPLHALVGLLAQARQVLAPGAQLVVVGNDPGYLRSEGNVMADDLVTAGSLHLQTWIILMGRAGFVGMAHLPTPDGRRDRCALAASVPA
jgi:hypothetical protein